MRIIAHVGLLWHQDDISRILFISPSQVGIAIYAPPGGAFGDCFITRRPPLSGLGAVNRMHSAELRRRELPFKRPTANRVRQVSARMSVSVRHHRCGTKAHFVSKCRRCVTSSGDNMIRFQSTLEGFSWSISSRNWQAHHQLGCRYALRNVRPVRKNFVASDIWS